MLERERPVRAKLDFLKNFFLQTFAYANLCTWFLRIIHSRRRFFLSKRGFYKWFLLLILIKCLNNRRELDPCHCSSNNPLKISLSLLCASNMLLFLTCLTYFKQLQCIQCPQFETWWATFDFSHFTELLWPRCSQWRVLRALRLWPQYFSLQFKFISYIPDFSQLALWSLKFCITCLRVNLDLYATLTTKSLKIKAS